MDRLGSYDVNSIAQGHVLDVLEAMPDESVHCCITSPPYWGLRDYGIEPQMWGGEEGCEHVWGEDRRIITGRNDTGESRPGFNPHTKSKGPQSASQGQFCSLCGAWRGSLGLEPDPALYVEHLVEVFREVRRVLRGDGTLWLNLGASYATGTTAPRIPVSPTGGLGARTEAAQNAVPRCGTPSGFKTKDLIPIPWMVAMALQRDGWWLRSSIIWAKGISFCPTYSGSCMPESVRDRPTQSYEYVFLMAKNKRYFYDQEAVREPHTMQPQRRLSQRNSPKDAERAAHRNPQYALRREPGIEGNCAGRNLRSVWTINPHPFPEAHFATFPPKLIEPMILAGTSEKGVCPECGSPWERVVEKSRTFESGSGRAGNVPQGKHPNGLQGGGKTVDVRCGPTVHSRTLGWQPTCDCGRGDTTPAIVLDPFCGSGTTPKVALELRRHYLGIDLSGDYVEMAQRRIAEVQPRLL